MIIGSEIICHSEVPSTNDLAAHLIKNNKPAEGTIIRADFQSAGRGRSGNSWESENGKNLLLSIILFPDFLRPENQFLLSMAISLGIRDFLRNHIATCTIKWPNDIYADDAKIAGILIENSLTGTNIESSVAGIGLNINQTSFSGSAVNPVSLKQLTGIDYDLSECLGRLSACLDKRYKQLVRGMTYEIREDYLSSLYRFREWHSFRSIHGIFTGRIISVTDAGLLQVEDRISGVREFNFREIGFTDKDDSSL